MSSKKRPILAVETHYFRLEIGRPVNGHITSSITFDQRKGEKVVRGWTNHGENHITLFITGDLQVEYDGV